MTSHKKLSEIRHRAISAIKATQKALKKHVGLIKRREKIASIVAMIERLRADIQAKDAKATRRHLKKLNELTKGFAAYAIKRRAKKRS